MRDMLHCQDWLDPPLRCHGSAVGPGRPQVGPSAVLQVPRLLMSSVSLKCAERLVRHIHRGSFVVGPEQGRPGHLHRATRFWHLLQPAQIANCWPMNLDGSRAGLGAPGHPITVNRRKARVPRRYAKQQRTADGICTGSPARHLF